MKRPFALLWLALVLLGGAYLGWRVHAGLEFRTDLMALLPLEAQDPAAERAHAAVTRSLSRQIILLVGHPDRGAARAAAAEITTLLSGSGLTEADTAALDADRMRRIGGFYAPYRAGLLAEADRDQLRAGNTQAIATRALSQVFGFIGMGDARMLRDDPFLLLPGFFAALPVPNARLAPDAGMLSLTQDGTTWVLIHARLRGEPFALDVQRQLSDLLDPAIARLLGTQPGLEILRLGAVFFAQAAAAAAMGESALIGIVSTIGAVLVVLAAFRALTPVWLSLLSIGVGVVMALAVCLALFGDLHVGALLFGVSLIGVAVDYSLQYCAEAFTAEPSADARLRRVRAAITMGAATSIIGYLTLLLAPFPGLLQVAAFSAIGLGAAWLTVLLWAPWLDRTGPARHGAAMLRWAGYFLLVWHAKRFAPARIACLAGITIAALLGMARFHTDDDVRRLQSLSPDLLAQQTRIQTLIGSQSGGQFFLLPAADPEIALQRGEALADRLRPLLANGVLAGFRGPASYVPSAQRQRENRALRDQHLDPAATDAQLARLGLPGGAALAPDNAPILTLAQALAADSPLTFLPLLVQADGQGGSLHIVMLDGVRDPGRTAAAAQGIAGVHYVDTVGSFSTLLGQYRDRAMALLFLSALLMAPLLAWRYGPRRAGWIMLPPLLAVALAPGLRALGGAGFSFFDAIALVLTLAIGVDYAVFLAETTRERRAVTMLAVTLAAITALLSFGLLALSQVRAVQHFGATMLVGILLALLLSPLARR